MLVAINSVFICAKMVNSIVMEILEWPKTLYDAVKVKQYGGIAGLAAAYYFLGNPLGQGLDTMQLAQQYLIYGVAVYGGIQLIPAAH